MTGLSVVVGMLGVAGIRAVMIVKVRADVSGLCVNVRRRVVVALGGGSLKHERRGRDEHEAQCDHPGKCA